MYFNKIKMVQNNRPFSLKKKNLKIKKKKKQQQQQQQQEGIEIILRG